MMLDWSRIGLVLEICLPVFLCIGLGILLRRRGWLNSNHRELINNLVYYLALPALIFGEVARQRFESLFNGALLIPALIATVVVGVLSLGPAWLMRRNRDVAAVTVFGAFWANVTYMGFPLAFNAFGREGLALAAVFNAFVMPLYLVLGLITLSWLGGEAAESLPKRLLKLVINPVVLAALAGIGIALLGELFYDEHGALALSAPVAVTVQVTGRTLKLIGAMGLPLALLSIGASLRIGGPYRLLLKLMPVIAVKLMVLPLLTLVLIKLWYPHAEEMVVGVAVMLSAMPNAVAAYVIGRRMGGDEHVLSALLVLSTLVGAVTIPLWLYWTG